jgi:branched-chain amino acid transport system substrate-binding protein
MLFKGSPNKLRPAFTIFVLAFALFACTNANLECQDEIGCIDLGPNEPIHLVYLLATSGDAAFLGVDAKGAIEIAIEDREFLLDHPIILTGEDSGCSGEQGRTAAEKIVADSATIVGVIGTSCSDAARAAIPLISDAGLVMISPSNTDPGLTDGETTNGERWPASYFRATQNSTDRARSASQYT